MKRILIVTQYIYPEPFKSSEMAFELVKRGYKVDVLTGIPNYPEGHYYKGYGLFRKRMEVKEGVTFYRCLQTPRKLLPGFIGLSLNYLTFAFNATLWVLFFFLWKKKYGAIITHEPSPITQIIPACILGNIKHIPVFSWIQDIWPDSVVLFSQPKYKGIYRALASITNWVYRNSTKLLITSKGMADLINRENDYSDKIVYYPQWSEDMLLFDSDKQLDIESVKSNDFTIMMIGSLNSGIGVEGVLSLCEEMKNDNVRFVFVGGGSEENNMRLYAKKHRLDKVLFVGRKPSDEMPYYFAQSDALLLSLSNKNLPHIDIIVPARMQSYLSAGKPIFAMAGKGVTETIKEAKCGFAVPAGDYQSLADIIRNKIAENFNGLSELGNNGRKYYETYFTKDKSIDDLCRLMNF